jgi:hypothetical protein
MYLETNRYNIPQLYTGLAYKNHDKLLLIACKKLIHPLHAPPFFACGIIDSSIETAIGRATDAAFITPSKAA